MPYNMLANWIPNVIPPCRNKSVVTIIERNTRKLEIHKLVYSTITEERDKKRYSLLAYS